MVARFPHDLYVYQKRVRRSAGSVCWQRRRSDCAACERRTRKRVGSGKPRTRRPVVAEKRTRRPRVDERRRRKRHDAFGHWKKRQSGDGYERSSMAKWVLQRCFLLFEKANLCARVCFWRAWVGGAVFCARRRRWSASLLSRSPCPSNVPWTAVSCTCWLVGLGWVGYVMDKGAHLCCVSPYRMPFWLTSEWKQLPFTTRNWVVRL